MSHLWIRNETKKFEKRTALIPKHVVELIKAGHKITVENSSERIFKDEEYKKVGCEIASAGSWKTAPKDAFILGVKEIEETQKIITHKQIHFAHVYKNQTGWEKDLARYKNGEALLYDLEFLTNADGRRVAAFGFSAGVTGVLVSLLIWCQKEQGQTPSFKIKSFYESKEEVIAFLEKEFQKIGRKPTAMVIGALGRVGLGSVDILEECGIRTIKWDVKDTKKGGPFYEILDHDIFVNSVYLTKKIPYFLTKEMLKENKKLSIIADISCDPNGPNNPLPVYDDITTFGNPSVRVLEGEAPIDVMAIDHLPSFLPRESSIEFSTQLLPHIKNLLDGNDENSVWKRAENLYNNKINEI
ncbi:MAG: saccharopine dehydrogenase [Alphaproteobacteria bacterium]